MRSASFNAAASAALIMSALTALTACSSVSSPPPRPVVAAPAAPEPLPAGVVGVAVGKELDEKDRDVAIAAQDAAVNSGQRKTWKGSHGAFGFITPGPETGVNGCRDYAHKIFINGRPNEAKGQACKKGDVWRVVS